MKINNNIKCVALLILGLSIGASAVSAQKKPTAANKNIWQEVKMENWGFKFSIPKDLKEMKEPPSAEEETSQNSDEDFNEWKAFARSTPKAARLEVTLFLRSTKGETAKSERGGKPIELTAEQLMTINYLADSRDAENPEEPTLEATYQQIDGVNGYVVVRNVSYEAKKSVKAANDVRLIWGTYRIYKGNLQQIMFSVEGKRTQLATMKKIINSLKFNL